MAQAEFIEKLHEEIAGLKKQIKQIELRQRAKKELFGTMSIERLSDENKRLTEENKRLVEEKIKRFE